MGIFLCEDKSLKKYIFLLAAILLLLCLSFGIAADTEVSIPVGEGPASGVYTIKNIASGEYLNAFDRKYAAGGFAYTDMQNGEEGENILLVKQDDGTYLLYPQSEAGEYAFCMQSTIGERVSKSAEIGDNSCFKISGTEGGYVISSGEVVLGTTNRSTLYRMTLVEGEEYGGASSQLWDISPVALSSFELKTVADEVKLYGVSSVYAVTKPAYMAGLAKWSSSDDTMLMIDDDGSFCALKAGTVTVTATIGDESRSIDVKIVDEDAFTWYSQHLATKGGWHGGELANVYFYSGSHKRFIINGYNRGLDWMDTGCALTSVAMVLHNLGARYEGGYDFRFEADGNLEADPYTVALANSGNRGLTSSKGTLYNNPIMINIKQIAESFTLYGQPLEAVRTYGVTKKKLKEALDEHPEGVIVSMENSYNGSHHIVVTECVNPDETNPEKYRFKIYDSAGQVRAEGDDVLFENSTSYGLRYRYYHMRSMIVFNFVPTEK